MTQRILTLVLVCLCCLTPASAFQGGSLNVGLVGYWSFDQSVGSVAADSSGNGRDGTLVRNPTWSAGASGNALQFNATDNDNDDDDPKVVIGRTFDIATLPFTLTAWVHPDDFNDWRAIFSKRDNYTSDGMRFDVGLSLGGGEVYVYTGSFVQFSHSPVPGTWTHLAVVATPTDTRLYFNGVLQQTAGVVALGTSSTANTAIGGNGEGPGGDNDPFKGMIDEVRVYNRALSASEVQQVAALTSSNVAPSISLSAPASGATFTAPATITFTANASDSDGTVTKVEFFQNGTKVGEDLVASDGWSFAWTNVAVGNYTLTARATDNDAAVTTSAAVDVTVTPAADVTAPVITGTTVSAVTKTTATITWTTNEPSDSQVEYGSSPSFGSQTTTDTTLGTTHTRTISGLVPGTPYNYRARSRDAAGNLGLSGTLTFTTLSNVVPSISLSAPASGATFTAPATITFTANASDSDGTVTKVEFFQNGTKVGEDLVASDGWSFAWTNVAVGSYALTARATDNDAAVTTSSAIDVTVTDGTAPVITGTTVSAVTKTTATITWTTNEPSDSQVEYGSSPSFGSQTTADSTLSTTHTQTISGLLPGTPYNYRARSRDAAGNLGLSGTLTFTTLSNVVPSISLSAPASGATFTAPATITFTANASDSDGTVTKVAFFQNGVKVGEDLVVGDGWSFAWTNVAVGSYTLTARATDNDAAVTISSAIDVTVTPAADVTAPVITTVTASSITTTTATITWTTNELSDSQVEYGSSPTYGSQTTADTTLGISHTQTISGLLPGTPYNYRVRSRDAAGNLGLSGNLTLTTAVQSTPNGLVGYWKLDEGAGTGTYDSSGNGNNGTLVRNPIWSAGASGNALQFNATDNGNDDDDPKVMIGRTFDIATLPFTLTAWVHPDDFNDWRAIFSKRDNYTSDGMRFDVGLSLGGGEVYVYTGSFVQFSHSPVPGTWTHLAVVATPTDTRLYFNGVLQQTAGVVALGTSSTANTAIGGNGEGPGGDNDPFKGMIDEVRVYNRALSASEVQQVAALTSSNVAPSISLSAPASGATFTAPATITFTANASDSDGTVTKVEFFQNGTKVGEDLVASDGWSFAWTNVAVGTYTLTARATDNDAAVTTSAAVDVTVTPAADVTAPVITGTTVSAVTKTTATITWTTNEPSDSQVEYGSSPSFGSQTTTDTTLGTTHTRTISGLVPGTPYNYRARSRDAAGNLGLSGTLTFTTLSNVVPSISLSAPASGATFTAPATITFTANASDSDGTVTKVEFFQNGTKVGEDLVASDGWSFAWTNVAVGSYALTARATDNDAAVTTSSAIDVTVTDGTAPVITGTTVSAVTKTTATITWTTNEPSDSQVEYGSSPSFGSQTTADSTLSTTHTQTISGLLPGTPYNYRARSRDAAGNLGLSGTLTFTTLSNVVPSISLSAPANGATFTAPATITFTANASDSDGTVTKVAFFQNGVKVGEDLVVGDGWSFAWTNVAVGSYTLTARATDNDAAVTISSAIDVTVTPAADVTAPVITTVTASSITTTTATITWTTNEPSDSQVEYGTSSAYGSSTPVNASMVTSHSVTISGLTSGTTYHFRVKSKDASDNLATSGDNAITTTTGTPASFSAHVDFQPVGPTYAGYLVDSGAPLADRGNGFTYGWTYVVDTRIRNSTLSADQRYDTFAIMGNEAWEVMVPSGTYTVHVVVGDGDWADISSKLKVEGVMAIDGQTTASNRWLEGTLTVSVSDGRLTVTNLPGSYNKICYIDITSAGGGGSDTTPPSIAGVVADNMSSTGARIGWSTNEPANSQVEYGTTTAYGSQTTMDSSMVMSHSQALSGLTASTNYNYRVKSRDAAGNPAVSANFTFTTLSNMAPSISLSAPASGATFTAPATITFTANASDSNGTVTKVEFFQNGAKVGEDLVASDGWSFAWTNVAVGNYTLTARATDNDAAVTTSAAVNVTVTPTADVTAPVITAVTASSLTQATATITWTTDEPADSQVVYGLSPSYGSQTITDPTLRTTHTQTISGLLPGTLYNYQVRSRDAAGNLGLSGNLTFTTTAQSTSNGLVGYWAFDEGAGTGAYDSSANGNNGTLVRNPIWSAGVSGYALQFNATDNGNDDDDPKVVIGRTFDIATLPFTLTAWVHPDDFNDWRAILSKRDSYFAMRFDVGLSPGGGQVYVYTGGFVQFNHGPAPGTWTHIAVVATATDTRLYFNGVLQETAGVVALGTSATANTAIGGTGEGPGGDNDPFKGMIDEVRVYDRALSASEVQELWFPASTGILSVSATNITTSGATINWNTSAPSDSQVEYGRSLTYGSRTTVDPTFTTSHSLELSGLLPNTTYNYRVLSRNTAGTLAISPNFRFKTGGTTQSLSYTTGFDDTERPLSENGAWSNGQTIGIDWNDVQTSLGKAYAADFSTDYNDAIAILNSPTFNTNQYAEGTVYRAPDYSPGASHEIELLLRFQITPHYARGYEVLWSHAGNMAIVRWNGPLADYTALLDNVQIGQPADGDVLRAEIIDSVITVYKNGTLVATSPADTTYVDGQPGVGFWPKIDGATPSSFGWNAYEAGNLN